MKILHVFKSKIYSGAENVVCQIILGLRDQYDFVYMAPRGPIEDKLKALGLYDTYYPIDRLDIKSIKAAVDDIKPDIVQAHDFTASVLCGLALRGRVPTISHIHSNPLWLSQRLNVNSLAYLAASPYFSHIIAVSSAVEEEYCYANKLKCGIKVLGNPFSVERVLNQAKQDPDEDLASDILYVGRFQEAKNPFGAIQIVEAYSKQYSDMNIKFKMVGGNEARDQDLFDKCRDYVTNNGLTDLISFEGFQPNVYKYMAHTRVLLMPSAYEGFGLVALEAMALGIPVVCSGAGGLSNIVDDSCGFICKEKDDYLSPLHTLLTDPDVYGKMSQGASHRASQFDNMTDYLSQMSKLYTV
ncbi:MAG: glycosyltransferase [Pseudobutyrivibrio sp.]|nr:glycosyltransferase [Pseudobutyrivibrio sp.]